MPVRTMAPTDPEGPEAPEPVSIGLWLALHPPAVERAFWSDKSTHRWLHLADHFGMCMAIVNNLIYRAVSDDSASAFAVTRRRVPLLLIALALLQLGVMLLARPFYARHRHRITVANRCLRLVGMTSLFHRAGPHELHQMVLRLVKPDSPGGLSLIKVQLWAVTILLQGMVIFPLPIQNLVAFQLAFITGLLLGVRKRVCAAALSPPLLAAAPGNCRTLQAVAYTLASNLPSATPSTAALMDSQLCLVPAAAMWLVQVYLDLLCILVLPVVATYWVELAAKRHFVQSKGLQLRHTCRPACWPGSRLLHVAVGATLLAVLWMLVENAYILIKPRLEC